MSKKRSKMTFNGVKGRLTAINPGLTGVNPPKPIYTDELHVDIVGKGSDNEVIDMANATSTRIAKLSDEQIATELFKSIKTVKAFEQNINVLKAELIARGHANTVIHTSKNGEVVTIGADSRKTTDVDYLGEEFIANPRVREILTQVAMSKVLRITVQECEDHGLTDAITTKKANPRVDILGGKN